MTFPPFFEIIRGGTFDRRKAIIDERKATIASNLIKLRLAAGMTQAELGEKLNYSDKSISKWERGDVTTDEIVLMQISGNFGEDEDYNQADAAGFINLFGLSIKERAKLSKNWPEVK